MRVLCCKFGDLLSVYAAMRHPAATTTVEMVLNLPASAPLPIHCVFPSSRMLSVNTRAFLELAAAQEWVFKAKGRGAS